MLEHYKNMLYSKVLSLILRVWLQKIIVILFAILVTATAIVANAHDGAKGVVKTRMELMTSLAASMKSLRSYATGKTHYDSKLAEAETLLIQNSGSHKLTSLFPEGSLMPPSEATGDIWNDWDRFTELADLMSDAAAELATEIAKSETDFPISTFKKLGKSCASCHKNFRIKD